MKQLLPRPIYPFGETQNKSPCGPHLVYWSKLASQLIASAVGQRILAIHVAYPMYKVIHVHVRSLLTSEEKA